MPLHTADALGRSQPLLAVPGIDGYGVWRTFTWYNEGNFQHGAVLVPEVPPWRHLFAALDEIGASLPDVPPPSEVDEGDAITACCWRYGSYFHVLTGGERYSSFRTDSSLSRIADAEMRRINIEFCASVAAWLVTKTTDPHRIARRVRAACATLPMPWRSGRYAGWDNVARRVSGTCGETIQRSFEEGRDEWAGEIPGSDVDPVAILRMEANWIVLRCYRNGPIEDLHSGTWSEGTEVPGFQRFYGREVQRLARKVSVGITDHLFQRTILSPDALRAVSAAGSPRQWTLTEETSTVAFAGMPDRGPLEPRLRLLAERFPRHFSGTIVPAEYDIHRNCFRE